MKIGIILFEGAEELDFVGPWEVLTMAAKLGVEVTPVLVAKSMDPVRCAKGMRVLPDATLSDAGELDAVLVPGGEGTRALADDRALLDWLASVSAEARWVTSVCTGSLLLAKAGLTRGKRITTHWAFADTLRPLAEHEVVDDVRFVRDGNLLTAAGVSAGIDMALWLVGEISDPVTARAVQRAMQYDPAPPYAAEV